MNTNDFINSIDNKLYNKIRKSQSDAECRRYLKEHLQKQLKLYGVVGQSEQFKCDCGCTNHYKNEMYDSVKCANCGTVYARI